MTSDGTSPGRLARFVLGACVLALATSAAASSAVGQDPADTNPSTPLGLEYLGTLEPYPTLYQAMAFLRWGDDQHVFAHAARVDGDVESLHIVDSELRVIREIQAPGLIASIVDLPGSDVALLIDPHEEGSSYIVAMNDLGEELWRFAPDEGVSHMVARGKRGKSAGIAAALQDAPAVVGLDLAGHTRWRADREGAARVTDMDSELEGRGLITVCAASVQVLNSYGRAVDSTEHGERPDVPAEVARAGPASTARAAVEGRFTVRARLLPAPSSGSGQVAWIAQGVRLADMSQVLWRQDLVGDVTWERELEKRPDAWCLVPGIGVLTVDDAAMQLVDFHGAPLGEGEVHDTCKTRMGSELEAHVDGAQAGMLGDQRTVAVTSLSGICLYRLGP